MTVLRVLLAGAVTLLAFGRAVAAEVVVMHGYIGPERTLLWMQTKAARKITLDYGRAGAADRLKASASTRSTDDFVAHFDLEKLAPATTYAYSVFLDGASAPAATGEFRTRTATVDYAAEIRVALGSCTYLVDGRYGSPPLKGSAGFGIFDEIAARKPDLMLWLGDNVYLRGNGTHAPDAEWSSAEAMSARFRAYRDFPALHPFLKSTSHLAIWDDHDFWYNDGGGASAVDARAADQSRIAREVHRRYWANPAYGTPEVPGTFGRVTLGDIEFFLLDNRTYRVPRAELPRAGATMLGPGQMRWLREALKSSNATFKVIVSGTQMWNSRNTYEAFHSYPEEQRELREFITSERLRGVVFLSGDRHFTQMHKLPRVGTYPFYEFTSSPLNVRAFESPPELKMPFTGGEEVVVDPKTGKPAITTVRNFGMLRVSGPREDRRLVFETYDAAGTLQWSFEVAANALQ